MTTKRSLRMLARLPMLLALMLLALVLRTPAASAPAQAAGTPAFQPRVAVQISRVPLNTPAVCHRQFRAQRLPHTTQMRRGAGSFDSLGSGLAVGDLNNDGRLDAVLGNLAGEGSILWNTGLDAAGQVTFRRQRLGTGTLATTEIRDIKLVDLNADGQLDLTLTHTRGGLEVWLAVGGTFRRVWLAGVRTPAYTLQWDDLLGQGQLNLVTGSYDAVLEAELGSTFLFASNGGVAVYGPLRRDAHGLSVQGQRLAGVAQTLALLPFDLDGDGRRELVVGHDFGSPDRVYRQVGGRWSEVRPFGRVSRNTMSLSATDLNNDGQLELFATDMKPDFRDSHALAVWMPLMQRSYQRLQYGDIQRAENVLQRPQPGGRDQPVVYRNAAYDLGLDATGWSWSAQFGDLDNDGYEDLYVVNGMIDEVLFEHLKGGELIERNRAYRNTGQAQYAAQPQWGLGASASGRSMVMADFDNDGRLDIMVNNLNAPATLYRNQLCGGSALEVSLRWPGSGNLNALGATLLLHLGDPAQPQHTQFQQTQFQQTLRRDVRSGSGYLSGTPARVHFGLPAGQRPAQLEVRWPDGARSLLALPPTGQRLTLTRAGGPS